MKHRVQWLWRETKISLQLNPGYRVKYLIAYAYAIASDTELNGPNSPEAGDEFEIGTRGAVARLRDVF